MIVFGSEFVPYDEVVLEDFSGYSLQKKPDFLRVKSKKEAIFANANGVKFIVCDNLNFARQLQALANDYIFDSKIAVLICDDFELEAAIDARIDASIYKSVIRGF
ncbi:hypothetical protein Q4Y15_001257 [Campylobacter fetus]|uniref:Uncharacterized protein n=3 Tax=Campylobacter fetus TaxID=196 RepID=A0A5L8VB68_CAMFE|nr:MULTISPECIES: hypothetical protein [Campylobacter]OCS21558.1 hypothetical protein CFVI97532_09060 [Campylobacter fetus subsp. venerealis cfvi97/532]OCS25843.1 hypothetical protein CFVB10_06405 [Campylobacter fetus subsp. venerealis cfvB10]OCS29508.1 hypothetical protein CFVCCUG33900_06240 [Campylobacter fetus subsp. venerealis LMG 6570 = CCUG 33900]OCS42460.1 hypothetical protein CFVI02298_05230 [Campylobacter fetus subsp. venerealis cfvi02/298]ABK82660.1 conserved hypothetical protein [Cam